MTQRVSAIYLDGNVVLDHAVDWPDGTRIEICPVEQQSPPDVDHEALARALNDPDSYGLNESLWPTTPEGIELLLAHMDAAKPLELTPEERRAIDDDRESNRQVQKKFVRESWSELEELF